MNAPSMWIQNVSVLDVRIGSHRDAGPNSMLISISDTASSRPVAKQTFKERHNFEFFDVEADDYVLSEEMRCSEAQAAELVRLLQHAFEEEMNVVVHCTIGVCRSGAVCEVGVMMGFEDPGKYRSPNLLVKELMMKCLEAG